MKEADFLIPQGKSKAALKREVNSGRFPPYVCYKILYSLPEERQAMPIFLKVELHGADVPLFFTCRIKVAESEFPGLFVCGLHCPHMCIHVSTIPSSNSLILFHSSLQPPFLTLQAEWLVSGMPMYIYFIILHNKLYTMYQQ